MYEKKLLDHGYLKLCETWGSDEMIVESARMSTGKGFLGWGNEEKSGDEKLLRFLYEARHSTPFEFAGMTIEVQAPLMVFREWHRHRTQSYSERSARYAPLPAVDYLPTAGRCLMLSKTNKQAGSLAGSKELTIESALLGLAKLSELYEHCERTYQELLEAGFPKEIARLALTVGRYSTMRASTDLRNWLGFATLRVAPSAQWEIRQYADAVVEALAEAFPRTTALFADLKRGP